MIYQYSDVSRLAPLLCLFAIACAQVPLLACASDCQDVLVSAGADHDCHTRKHDCVHHEHRHGDGCGHDHASHAHDHASHAHDHRGVKMHAHGALSPLGIGGDHHDEKEDGHPEAVHELIHISVVSAGFPCELPPHAPTATALDVQPVELPSIHLTLEAAHQAEPDPVPVPLPASVSLLL